MTGASCTVSASLAICSNALCNARSDRGIAHGQQHAPVNVAHSAVFEPKCSSRAAIPRVEVLRRCLDGDAAVLPPSARAHNHSRRRGETVPSSIAAKPGDRKRRPTRVTLIKEREILGIFAAASDGWRRLVKTL
jgi:hypothetical protein